MSKNSSSVVDSKVGSEIEFTMLTTNNYHDNFPTTITSPHHHQHVQQYYQQQPTVLTPTQLDCESSCTLLPSTTTPLSSSIVQSPLSTTSSLNLLDCNSISSFTSPSNHLFSNNSNTSSSNLDPKMNETSHSLPPTSNNHYPQHHFPNIPTNNSTTLGGAGGLHSMADWAKLHDGSKSTLPPSMYTQQTAHSYPPPPNHQHHQQQHSMMHPQQQQQPVLPPHYPLYYHHPNQTTNGGFYQPPHHQGYFQPPPPRADLSHQYMSHSYQPQHSTDATQAMLAATQQQQDVSNTDGGNGNKSSGSSTSSESSSDESIQPPPSKKKQKSKKKIAESYDAASTTAPYSPTNTTFTETAIDEQGGNFQLAQIACTNCRSRHKKCSRELPVCNYCKKMGKDCVYLKSRKGQDQQNRKKKKKKKDKESVPPTNPITTEVPQTICPPPSTTNVNVAIPPTTIPTASPAVPSISMNTSSNFSNPVTHTPHSVVQSSSSGSSNHNEMSPLPSSLHGSSPLLTHQFNPMAYSERDFKDPNSISVMLSSFVHSINFRYTAHKLLDLYYKELCAGFALVDKSLMEGLIEQLMGNDGNSNASMILNHMQLDSTTQDGLISILYSIQALALQQSGDYVLKGDYRQKLMEYMHNLAKEKISKYFDNMDNIYIAVALHYLTDYVCGEGDMRKTSLYLAMVKQMIGLHGYGGPTDQQVGATQASYSAQDSPSLPKFLLRILVRYKETFLSDYMSKVTGKPSSATKLFGIFASRIKLDTSFFDKAEKGQISSQYLPLIENVVRIAHTYYSLLFETMYQAQGDLFCLFSNVFIREFYLDLYSKVENIPAAVLVSYANEIISYTKTEKYIFAPFVIANGIAKAVAVRLEYWRQTGDTSVDFKDDLRALKVLSTRYGVVQKLYGDLINQIENATLLQSMNETNSSRLFGANLPDAFQNVQQQMPTQPQPPQQQVMVNDHEHDAMQQFDDSISFSPLMDPFNPNNGNLLSMLFNEVGNERCESLNEESYFMDDPQMGSSDAAQQDRDHNPFIKGYSLVKMMIKQLSKLKDALHISEPKYKEESLKKAKTELIEELSKALPNDIEAKFILELTKHQHPHQIHPCQYSHLALLFE
ncbi:predicted protein [Naegleria gruberi]|uniref:Predicted protein n=1 Tax=Naegleria gruberi TaxID=5762 RepID=D2VQW2_NAEGR|nr:uncharacterized protein NAEGRDRAFT_80905 [Naegleria gruberi]EFC40782.1 predicted protein [Naegleria gruberi]|eukprot:XP_002673526.1 predicted protein [Naegleria gruberi strain NEG-M]